MRYKKIAGWFDYDDIFEQMLIRCKRPGHIVEIGTLFGKSAAYMGERIKETGYDIQFDTIDTFEGSPAEINGKHKFYKTTNVLARARENLKNLPVNIIVGHSLKVVERYKDKSLDFVFIDGSHLYQDVLNDIRAYYPKVKPDGFIGGHDYNNNDVFRAVNEFFGVDCAAGSSSWLIKKTNKI